MDNSYLSYILIDIYLQQYVDMCWWEMSIHNDTYDHIFHGLILEATSVSVVSFQV